MLTEVELKEIIAWLRSTKNVVLQECIKLRLKELGYDYGTLSFRGISEKREES